MKLDEHHMRLIAVGASVAANCLQCLETNLTKAIECGADEDEIQQSIWVGRTVRKGAASKLDDFATIILNKMAIPVEMGEKGCQCSEKSRQDKGGQNG